jgi:hypothetical protein
MDRQPAVLERREGFHGRSAKSVSGAAQKIPDGLAGALDQISNGIHGENLRGAVAAKKRSADFRT